MTSPCKDCKRRKVGCHNTETCVGWAEYVEANKTRLLAQFEAKEEYEDRKQSSYRHAKRRRRG